MVEKARVVLLFLEAVDRVLASPDDCRDIVHFVVPLFLVVRWGRHLPLLRLPLVHAHLPKFRPHVLKAHLVQPQRPNLNLEVLVLTKVSSLVQLSINVFFHKEFPLVGLPLPISSFCLLS